MTAKPDQSLELLCTTFEGYVDFLASNIVDMFTNGEHFEAADMARTFADLVETAAKSRERTLESRKAHPPAEQVAPAPVPERVNAVLQQLARGLASDDPPEPTFPGDASTEEEAPTIETTGVVDARTPPFNPFAPQRAPVGVGHATERTAATGMVRTAPDVEEPVEDLGGEIED